MSGEFIGRLHNDHRSLTAAAGMSGFNLPELTLASLKVETTFIATVEDVEAALDRYRPGLTAGWLRRESWAGSFGTDPGLGAAGAALEGEWVLSQKGKSASLLYDGRRFRMITFEEGAEGGRPVLREEAQLVGPTGDHFVYAVYWGAPADDLSDIRRLATRLLGVGEIH